MTTTVTPTPGDPATEPVATAAQSHVDGRVGPPTVAQDATADYHAPAGVEQIEPGTVLPADTPSVGGPVEGDRVPGREELTASDTAHQAGATARKGARTDRS